MQSDVIQLLTEAGLEDAHALTKDLAFRGADPVLATHFRTGETAAIALAGCGVLASRCWQMRSGATQQVAVEVEAAAISLLSFIFQRLTEPRIDISLDRADLTDFYPTRDGRWFMLHAGFPHLQRGALDALRLEDARPSDRDDLKRRVTRAIAERDSVELEATFDALRICGAVARTQDEWRAHPQGRALAARPVVEVLRVADGPARPFERKGTRPLDSIRVLDLTRVLAGPTCSRTLAEHGADVLKITSPDLPSIPLFVMDTSHGKRSAFLDLKTSEGAARLEALTDDADVFVQGYRAGAMERLGFGTDELLSRHPGLIHVSINCYGHDGPWHERAGWEQLAQTVTGIAIEQGAASTDPGAPPAPQLLPAAATDYTTGYLAAFGTLAALVRRATEGGSYRVRVSLARTGMWLQDRGRTDQIGPGPNPARISARMQTSENAFGVLSHLGPVVELSETPATWTRPTTPLGAHPATW